LSQKLRDVNEKMKRKLHIEIKKVVLPVDDLKFWHNESKQLLNSYRRLHRQLCMHLYKKKKIKKKKKNDDGMTGSIRIQVPQRFRLQEMFEKWYQSGDNDTTYLMRSLNESDKEPDRFHVSRFFQPWCVGYDGTFLITCLFCLFESC
jgi:hypothetical protein